MPWLPQCTAFRKGFVLPEASQWEWRMLQFVQDILYRPKSSPINLALRYALFDTESYNSRIYSFENNALYVFSVPANYYQGSRAYVLFRLKFLRRFDLWIKYGVRIFSNRQSLGTGPEKIDGNRKTDLTVQLRMKF
ncbi:hypothetical protein N8758_04435 [Crocinitomicaceae bacterium]|nr:hypothetical protein [Crocinitomicaceae bacterium]